jgi:hypothetical protein
MIQELRVIAYSIEERCHYNDNCPNRIKFKIKENQNKVIHYSCPVHLAGWMMDQMGITKVG